MRIGGLQKFSLIDYPGKIAAVIFTQGCNFRCPYCYNPQLVFPSCFRLSVAEDKVFSFLKKRQGQLQGVVVTGGEPTIHKDLVEFLQKLKEMDFAVKLDTNGSHPEVLQKLIQNRLVDYFAMDVKAPLEQYSRVAGVPCDTEDIKRSIQVIIHSGIAYQFRTTVVRPFVSSSEDVAGIAEMLGNAGHYVLQAFINNDQALNRKALSDKQFNCHEMDALREQWERIPETSR